MGSRFIFSLFYNDLDSFQNGVDSIVDKCTSCGSTPTSSTPNDIITAIQNIYTNRYNTGYNAGQSNASPSVVQKTVSSGTYQASTFGLSKIFGAGVIRVSESQDVSTSSGTFNNQFTVTCSYTSSSVTVSAGGKFNYGTTYGSSNVTIVVIGT